MGRDTGILTINPRWSSHAGKHKFYVTQRCTEGGLVPDEVTEVEITVIAEPFDWLIYKRPYFFNGLHDIEKMEGEKWVWSLPPI